MVKYRIMIGLDFEPHLNLSTIMVANDVALELSKNHTPNIDFNRIVLITSYCLLFVLGMIGNLWVGFIVGRVFRQSRTEAPKSVQIFILSLCICEMLMLIFLIFLISDLIFGRWMIASRFLCRLYLSSEGMNKFWSPFLLASLSGFCYNRLRGTPTSAHSSASTRKASFLVILCALIALGLMGPVYKFGDLYYLIEYNESRVLHVVMKCAFHPPEKVMVAFTAYGFVAGYVVPAALFTFFYAAALFSARQQRKRSSCYKHKPNGSAAVDETQLQEINDKANGPQIDHKSADPLMASGSPYLKRVRATTFGLIFVYLICWTPYWAMSLYHCLTPHAYHGYESQGAIVFSYFVHMLPYINCVVYPLVYTLLNSHLRKDYKRVRAAERRRRLASRKPRGKLSVLNLRTRAPEETQRINSVRRKSAVCRLSVETQRGSLDGGTSRTGSSTGGRGSSTCDLLGSLEPRFFFGARSSLRRNNLSERYTGIK